MLARSVDALFLLSDQVLHDAHFVLVPASEPLLELCDDFGWLWPVELAILLFDYNRPFRGPLRDKSHTICFVQSAYLLQMLPMETFLVKDVAFFVPHVAEMLHHFAILRLPRADCAVCRSPLLILFRIVLVQRVVRDGCVDVDWEAIIAGARTLEQARADRLFSEL